MKLSFPIFDIEAYSFSWLPQQYDSRMYLLRCHDEAVCVDPCINTEAESFLETWKPKKLYVLLTHEHADHISGVNLLQEKYGGKVICTEMCGKAIKNEKENMSQYMENLCIDNEDLIHPFVCSADTVFNGKLEIDIYSHKFTMYEMPGHSKGSAIIVVDNAVAFTGDNLIPGKPTITRLPGGSKKTYENVVCPFIKGLPKDMLVLPGHCNPILLKYIYTD